ncbi:hypothetical protein KKD19_01115 [Patescibacteria group bacterium]|nr:hypothetical protein [Patescibacteria group bacterium]MBU4511832.1 hypothetical protein [Patescibacteria group bacterium]MCG2693437.1 hypothetical protein [Candidatus Parcubacteria bacterium]
MFNPFKKSKKQKQDKNPADDLTKFEKAPGVDRNKGEIALTPEYREVRTMPGKFLRNTLSKASAGKSKRQIKLVLIVIILIIFILGFSGLLLFSKSFNELLFGKKEIIFDEPLLPAESLAEISTSTEETIEEEVIQTLRLEAEAKDFYGDTKGTISFEIPENLSSLDLRVWAIDMPPKIVKDDQGQEFEIIGGVYAFYPSGDLIPGEELLVTFTYQPEDLPSGTTAVDLLVVSWQQESNIKLLMGIEEADFETVLFITDSLPEGNIALVVPVTTEPAGPVVSIMPTARDSDNDGLTDEEESLYLTDLANPDTDGDGYPDGAEVLNLYNPSGSGLLSTSGLVQVYTNEPYGYLLFYPRLWSVAASQGEGANIGRKVIFSAPSLEEFIEIHIEDNPLSLPALDWYLDQSPGVQAAQVRISDINGHRIIWSPGGSTAYIAKENLIYLITYNMGIREEASFKTTFELLINSFQFNEEEKIIYQNETYNFKLELPPGWQGYEASSSESSWGEAGTSPALDFKLPTKQQGVCSNNSCLMFTIYVFDYSIWSEVQKTREQVPTLIDVSGEHVFTYTQGTTIASDLAERFLEVLEIISSFALVE